MGPRETRGLAGAPGLGRWKTRRWLPQGVGKTFCAWASPHVDTASSYKVGKSQQSWEGKEQLRVTAVEGEAGE